MALKFGFFNSVDGDRVYNAEDIGRFLHGIVSSGVFPDKANNLKVYADGGMNVMVHPGRAMLDCHYLENDERLKLTLNAGGTLDRIDAVVMRVDEDERTCSIFVKEGTPSSNPARPTIFRGDNAKEYMLAEVYVKKLATAITQEDVHDTRPDIAVCGWVSGLIDQGVVSVPAPSARDALKIPTVNKDGTGYDLLPADTTLSFDGAVADAAAVGREFAKYAGHGLDAVVWLSDETDIDTVTTSGWYSFNASNNSPNKPAGVHADLLVIARSANFCTQVAYPVYIPGCDAHMEMTRKMVNGVWGEWEWVNPPMLFDVEYRTTERYAGKAVYTKRINFGAVEGKINFKEHGLTVATPIRCTGWVSMYNTKYTLPYALGEESIILSFDGTRIIIDCNWDADGGANGITAQVQLWYTKD